MPRHGTTLDVTPLVTYVESAPELSLNADLGATNPSLLRAYYRAKQRGRITIQQADRFATEALGLHPVEIWGHEWTTA